MSLLHLQNKSTRVDASSAVVAQRATTEYKSQLFMQKHNNSVLRVDRGDSSESDQCTITQKQRKVQWTK